MYVYVVGWHPSSHEEGRDDPVASTGGFEWRYRRMDALKVLMEELVDEIAGGARGRNIVFARIVVPFEVDWSRPRTADDLEHQITDWLDRHIDLFELPLQGVAV